ncbi:protein FAM83G [Anguilla rostrata]|uniref:protein FAM83G n=1 Tax=Anguilla rostrata TaxID=7938 RepID=UPI0030CC9484
MAYSQIQCLDDNHINWRMNESKPEFFYSEDQRLALEALIQEGRDAFEKYIQTYKIREFLSELELEKLLRTAEEYNPGSEHTKGEGVAEGEDGAVSLQYWPERSDISIPDLDMGWPDSTSYRGVTRVNVYTQPPIEGHTHIKEVVRKTIAQAQKVIAVAMDMFTDVDIFRDLLDAAFKRKVAVYIIVETNGVPHFLSMCERAGMHRGHLKNLRVRCLSGTGFYTRSSRKVHGSLSQKFMFVDGDRAVSGSYSFTWTASRLDRNLITVLTGQAVDTFDKQFRELYLVSRGVNLSKINLEDEPEPEPIPQATPKPPPSAAVARKMINPKYALVSSNVAETGSKTSSDKNSAKNSSSLNPMGKVLRRPKEKVEAPPLHPGLIHLERAYLIPYLPTWPEPDPPSDVIGFINIRDNKKPVQVHLMRSEMFETSQAIRFKDPFDAPKEDLPEKARLRKQSENSPVDAPNVQIQQNTQIDPQKTQDEPRENLQPLDEKRTPQNNQGREDIVSPPVPKPRTVQLVINSADCKDGPNVTLVKKPSMESTTPPTLQVQNPDPTSDSNEHTDCPGNAPISVTVSCEPPAEDAGEGGTDEDDQGLEMRAIGMDAYSNEADSTKAAHGHSPRANSNGSTPSEEYFECNDSDNSESRLELLANGGTTGSGRFEDHKHSDGLNVMARFSQSMLDLRPEEQLQQEKTHRQQEPANFQLPLKRSQMQVHQSMPFGNGRKMDQTVSRSPASILRNNWESQGRAAAKVVIAKPGSFHRPRKTAGLVIGGHKYWQGKLLNQDKFPARHSSPSRLAHMQPGQSRPSHSPSRHSSPHRTEALPTLASQTPFGISFAKLSQVKHLKGKISGSPLQKKTQLGHK